MGGWVEKRAGPRQEAGETDGSVQNGSKNQPQSKFDEVVAQSLAFKAQIATNGVKGLRGGPGLTAEGDWANLNPNSGSLNISLNQSLTEKKQAELGAAQWVRGVRRH